MANGESIDSMSQCVLIPAAGLGRRVGSPIAKEMLPHPRTGRPLIEFALECAATANARAHIITRKDKVNLLTYLDERSRQQEITVQLIEQTNDWPETLILSKPFWAELNVVCLPDTEFNPPNIAEQMFSSLSEAPLSFALAHTTHLKTFGALQMIENSWYHCEKPDFWNETAKAWGLFAFRESVGMIMLQQLVESNLDHRWRRLPADALNLSLSDFNDLTRTNS